MARQECEAIIVLGMPMIAVKVLVVIGALAVACLLGLAVGLWEFYEGR